MIPNGGFGGRAVDVLDVTVAPGRSDRGWLLAGVPTRRCRLNANGQKVEHTYEIIF